MTKMDKCLGFGGLGDCFIVALKLLEYPDSFIYTHIDRSIGRLKLSEELLDLLGIKHDCRIVNDIKQWWTDHNHEFDKCFNVFAKGYIDIPRRPYHWEPCTDEGFNNPFADNFEKYNTVAVQVNAGNELRNYSRVPLVEMALHNFDPDDIVWVGTDTSFRHEAGESYVGKLNLTETLKLVSECGYFIGFPGVLLYWSLYHKTDSFVFTDHQGQADLRIHEAWKEYITYDK